MKVYRLNRDIDYSKFAHSSDMIFIMSMLEDKGEVLVSAETIETLYYEFSEERACGWCHVDEKTLNEFAEWLDAYNM